MTYAEAKRRIRNQRLLACALWVVSLFLALVLFMRGIYESQLEAESLRIWIEWIYQHVPFVASVWQHIPPIDSRGRPIAALIVIAVPFVGYWLAWLLWQWARGRAARLRRIDEQIEDEMIRESLRPGERRSMAEIRLSIDVPKQSLWDLLHERYLSGFVVQLIGGIAAGAVLFWFGLN